MFVRKLAPGILAATLFLLPRIAEPKDPAITKSDAAKKGDKTIVLWRDPGDITSRNLFYGPGGKQHEPHAPFTFQKEDLDGTNAKFSARDANGIKWKVKMGSEVRPETAATRIRASRSAIEHFKTKLSGRDVFLCPVLLTSLR